MFGRKSTLPEPQVMYSESTLIAIVASIDELDRYECSEEAIGSCLTAVLGKMGYSDEDALCGALEATRHLDTSFQALYWKENSASNKVAVFTSTLTATKMLIEKNLINAVTREKVRQTLAEQKDNGSNKVSDK